MAQRNNAVDGEAARLAKAYANKYVYVVCHPGRFLHVVPAGDTNGDELIVKTVTDRQLATCVVVERLSSEEERRYGKSGLVSFRALPPSVQSSSSSVQTPHVGSARYLTAELYGDEIRQVATEALISACETNLAPLLPEHIREIIDYAFGSGTNDSNFEGRGYSYRPLTAPFSKQRPNMMQVFQLTSEPEGGRYCFGVKSLFNTYWRSQHWAGVVSQSPHCLADERFVFRDVHYKDSERITTRDW